MSFFSISKMLVSPDAIWPDLDRFDSTVVRVFAFLVVPLSLLPPAMIYWAGNHHGDAFVPGFSNKPWALIGALFFVCELVSVTCMAWLLRKVAHAWDEQVSGRNAYIIAAVAAIPLWVSSLGLLVPSLAFNIALATVALMLSCALIFQGVRSFCRIDEYRSERTFVITQLVFGGGLAAWGFLMLLLIIP